MTNGKRETWRNAVMAVVAAPVLLAAGCSYDMSDPPAEVGTVQSSLITAPDCLNSRTPTSRVWAYPHTAGNGTGYWSPFPNPDGLPPAIVSYEQSVWNIPRANGYEYMVKVVGDGTSTAYYFAIGIRDRNAVPAFLWQPPSTTTIRFPQPPAPFAATDNDYTAEVTLASDPANQAFPVRARYPVLQCVTVIAYDTGQTIDFFPIADLHDPSGHPW